MTALVTGGTGFVGSAVVRHLIDRGKSVRVLTRPGADRRNIADLDVETAIGDLLDSASLKTALAGCDALYHVAADYRLWVPDPKTLYSTNVDATISLMRAAGDAGVARIVYTSSVAVLSTAVRGMPSDEDTPVAVDDMIGHYKRSKFMAEAAVRDLIDRDRLPAVIVNPSMPIGPRDIKPTPTGRTIVEAASGRIPAFVETGLNVVHVDDVAAGHLLAHDKGTVGERYILGGHDMTLGQILESIAALRGHRPPRIRLPHGAIMPIAHAAEAMARLTGRDPFVTVDGVRMARKSMYYSSAKAESHLGYSARPAEDALRDALGWFAEQGYLR